MENIVLLEAWIIFYEYGSLKKKAKTAMNLPAASVLNANWKMDQAKRTTYCLLNGIQRVMHLYVVEKITVYGWWMRFQEISLHALVGIKTMSLMPSSLPKTEANWSWAPALTRLFVFGLQ